jgi:hypothetical protein
MPGEYFLELAARAAAIKKQRKVTNFYRFPESFTLKNFRLVNEQKNG